MQTDHNDEAAGFSELARELNLSDRVVARLKGAILAGRLKPGDALPSERELGEQFGVSRTVIREAVRSLSAMGLLEVRSGSGSRIATIDPSVVTDSMHLLLQGRGVAEYGKVGEVRAMLETHVVRLAADRASDAQLADLTRVHQQLVSAESPEQASVADVEFHRAICRMVDNDLYLVMLDAIGGMLLDVRMATLSMPGRRATAIRAHAAILQELLARNGDAAQDAMADHLAESQQTIESVSTSASVEVMA